MKIKTPQIWHKTMKDKKHHSKLAAIFSAGVKDYNHFISENKKTTIRIRTYYEEIMGICIQKHRGRLIPPSGNHLLAEFSSAEEALRCAGEIQQEIHAMNSRAPKKRRMNFRIGVTFGDVNEKKGRTYDESINVAIGLEDTVDEGEICISGTAYDQVKNKFLFTYNYQGDYTLKNVKEPVRAYRITIEPKSVGKGIDNKNGRPNLRKRLGLKVNIIVITAVVVLALWYFYFYDFIPSSEQVASNGRTASQLSDRPSVAVLPFVNSNIILGYEKISDRITIDIITDLAKLKEISVISRDRIIGYRGRPKRFKDIGRELGVQYVVEGSVRQVENKVRIYVHLMDTKGRRLWTERYERELDDLSTVQDEIVQKIVTVMETKR